MITITVIQTRKYMPLPVYVARALAQYRSCPPGKAVRVNGPQAGRAVLRFLMQARYL